MFNIYIIIKIKSIKNNYCSTALPTSTTLKVWVQQKNWGIRSFTKGVILFFFIFFLFLFVIVIRHCII